MMFSFGALPAFVRASYKEDKLNKQLRPWIGIFGAFFTSVVTAWFPLTAWFSGVTYLAPLVPFRAALLFGVSEIAAGILAAKISRSVSVGAASGVTSALILSGFSATTLFRLRQEPPVSDCPLMGGLRSDRSRTRTRCSQKTKCRPTEAFRS